MASIVETHPELVKQLHPTLNVTLDITKISRGSKLKVWWIGDCTHVWQAKVNNRAISGTGCPFCNGKLLKGFNDIATTHPELTAQWHPTKNEGMYPCDFTKGSNQKAWWVGECSHEWDAIISSRAINGRACPYCAGQKVLAGFNDLESNFPVIAAEWHPSKNGDTKPNMVAGKSNKPAWWLGGCGHEWKATIDKRTVMGRGCPVCSGNKVLVGYNDLATTHPELVSQWDIELNGPLKPTSISAGSKQKPWWKCNLGHSWQVSVQDRIQYSTGCPVCSGRKALAGFNDFASAYPELAKEFHGEKNGNISPHSLTCGSNIKVWWQCSIQEEHEWQTTVGHRITNGSGCPLCSNRVSKSEQEIADFLSESGLSVEQSNRTVLKGLELDIFIPTEKFAIEYNGLYWHSELRKKSTTYHYNKWEQAKSAGVQLVQIWEDEWLFNKDLVKKMLLHKLGRDTTKKIYGRNTQVVQLTKKAAEPFLEKNHIQGFQSGSYYYGLHDNDNVLRAIIVLAKQKDDTLNIVRYATSDTVIGGFTKLIRYAEKTLSPKRFVTFSDHCISDGGLYKNNGFVVDKELPPDYKYIVGIARKHKFGFRIKRFMNDPDLRWEAGLTEKELAQLNGISRIWDAGKTKWIKELIN